MKLVEILAREFRGWPEHALYIDQAADGDLIVNYDMTDDDYKYIGVHDLADDWTEAKVTRPEWQAERERVASECSLDNFARLMKNKDLPKAKDTNVVDYEQQLWDKAYLAAWAKSLEDAFNRQDYEGFLHATSGSAKMADAFMAERAKRLKK